MVTRRFKDAFARAASAVPGDYGYRAAEEGFSH
jgi:hypothetical protein